MLFRGNVARSKHSPLPFAAMPLGISPLNDFAFQKTFGTPENRESLISLLNAILKPKSPIAEVTILNPINFTTPFG